MADNDQLISQLMNEAPKINDGAKNYLSLKLAIHKTTPQVAEVAEDDASTCTDPTLCFAFAKSVLQSVNQFVMPNPVEWGALHPQGEEQKAVDRLDELAEYKVYHHLWSKVNSNPQAKATHLFGKTFLKFIWKDILDSVRDKFTQLTATNRSYSSEDLTSICAELVTEFESTFGETNTDPEAEDNLLVIVWAADYNKALEDRSKQRQIRAKANEEKHRESIKELGDLMKGHVDHVKAVAEAERLDREAAEQQVSVE